MRLILAIWHIVTRSRLSARPTNARQSVLVLFATILVILGWTNASIGAPKRAALIIGSNEYNHLPNLSNAVKDASDISVKLKSLGFETTLITNADRRSISRAIVDFPKDKEGYDAVLVYFAGHGMSVRRQNIWAN